MAGLTLLDGCISPGVWEEAERNVLAKLPAALPPLRVLLKEALVEGPAVTAEQWQRMSDYADSKDVAILASAVAQECRYLVTLNQKDFWPPSGWIVVVRPGQLLRELRSLLVDL